jgi:hypothetical protein
MSGENQSRGTLPGLLVVVGIFFLAAGLISGGPDVVGGIVFGVVSLAAAGAILHRRARDARPKDTTARPADRTPPEPSPRWRRWPWFVAGFLVVFIVLSITLIMYPQTPRGDAVEAHRLWEYYLIEVRRVVDPDHSLGPTSGRSWAATTTFVQHLLASTAGGMALLGVRWVVRKARGG